MLPQTTCNAVSLLKPSAAVASAPASSNNSAKLRSVASPRLFAVASINAPDRAAANKGVLLEASLPLASAPASKSRGAGRVPKAQATISAVRAVLGARRLVDVVVAPRHVPQNEIIVPVRDGPEPSERRAMGAAVSGIGVTAAPATTSCSSSSSDWSAARSASDADAPKRKSAPTAPLAPAAVATRSAVWPPSPSSTSSIWSRTSPRSVAVDDAPGPETTAIRRSRPIGFGRVEQRRPTPSVLPPQIGARTSPLIFFSLACFNPDAARSGAPSKVLRTEDARQRRREHEHGSLIITGQIRVDSWGTHILPLTCGRARPPRRLRGLRPLASTASGSAPCSCVVPV